MTFGRLVNTAIRPWGVELRRLPPPEHAPPPALDRPSRKAVSKRFKRAEYFQQLVDLIDDVPGDIVECGVGAGKSLHLLASLTDGGSHPRRLWGFDSFQGLPAPGPHDQAHLSPAKIRFGKLAYSEAEVRARLISYGASAKKIEERFVFVPGYFPESFPQYSGGPIALLHLDVDLYQSYKDCLEWFEPKVVPGGVVAFDEYRSGQWHGATRAIEEYYEGPPPGIQRSPNWNRWFLVKS